MKNKVLYIGILFSVFVVLLSSCKKDEIEVTATEQMAGQWYVKAFAVDENNEIIYDDPFGNGFFHVETYNTSANSETEMWLDCSTKDSFKHLFKARVSSNMGAMSFSAKDKLNVSGTDSVNVFNGKIMIGAAKTPSGAVADSIVFNVKLSSDALPATYGFDSYRISGYRYTGLVGDDD